MKKFNGLRKNFETKRNETKRARRSRWERQGHGINGPQNQGWFQTRVEIERSSACSPSYLAPLPQGPKMLLTTSLGY